jgi:hypothetical protein
MLSYLRRTPRFPFHAVTIASKISFLALRLGFMSGSQFFPEKFDKLRHPASLPGDFILEVCAAWVGVIRWLAVLEFVDFGVNFLYGAGEGRGTEEGVYELPLEGCQRWVGDGKARMEEWECTSRCHHHVIVSVVSPCKVRYTSEKPWKVSERHGSDNRSFEDWTEQIDDLELWK